MNAVHAYLNAFIDGEFDSFATHAWLVGIIAIAEISLGVGIWLESPKNKTCREWFGVVLVLGGCVISVFATVGLLIFDEGISRQQQSKIIELETRIAPRKLSAKQQSKIADAIRPFGKKLFDLGITPGAEVLFLYQIKEALEAGGWEVRNFGGINSPPETLLVPKGFDPGIGVIGTSGVRVVIDWSHEAEFSPAVIAFVDALKSEGFEASARVTDAAPNRPEIIHIQIGARL